MVNWYFSSFDDLSKEDLYEIIQLRLQVFVVEQDAPYQDCDGKDLLSYHFFGKLNGEIIAYARLIPAGITFQEPCLGRVVTAQKVRKSGYGRILVALALETMHNVFGTTNCRISAQLYLKSFYESFDFQSVSKVYLEDGLPHIEMVR